MSGFFGNRRKKPRRPADMAVDVRRYRRWGGWRMLEPGARGLDFNRFGMAFVSRSRLHSGDRLRLSLYGPAMRLHGVEARVVSSQRTGEGYRIGVCFYESLHELSHAPRAPYLRYLSGLEEQLPPA